MGEMKGEHLKDFIAEVRSKIEDKWEACCVALEERQKFTPFTCNIFTESLLTEHEQELAKLTQFQEENQELLALLEKRNELLRKHLELQANANDPRRFNNRGGGLLKEEQKRKRIEKELPQLELVVRKLAANFGERNGV